MSRVADVLDLAIGQAGKTQRLRPINRARAWPNLMFRVAVRAKARERKPSCSGSAAVLVATFDSAAPARDSFRFIRSTRQRRLQEAVHALPPVVFGCCLPEAERILGILHRWPRGQRRVSGQSVGHPALSLMSYVEPVIGGRLGGVSVKRESQSY